MTGLGFSCGACKFLRRKCTPDFSYDEASVHFSAVHKVFGASNGSKMLLQLPFQCRGYAAIAIAYEALSRIYDPVYGCVSHIFALQLQIANLEGEIEMLGAQMGTNGFCNASCATFEASKILHNGSNSSIQNGTENPNDHRNQLFPFLLHIEGATGDPILNTHDDRDQHDDLFATDKILQGLESDDFGHYY